jgi:ABC-type antimicrobial peptide transport system permease subunit
MSRDQTEITNEQYTPTTTTSASEPIEITPTGRSHPSQAEFVGVLSIVGVSMVAFVLVLLGEYAAGLTIGTLGYAGLFAYFHSLSTF